MKTLQRPASSGAQLQHASRRQPQPRVGSREQTSDLPLREELLSEALPPLANGQLLREAEERGLDGEEDGEPEGEPEGEVAMLEGGCGRHAS